MTVAEKLNAKGATPETILQIMDATVFEESDDRRPEDMLADLNEATDDGEIEMAIAQLRAKPEYIDEIALYWIGSLSEEEDKQHLLDGAIEDADKFMPAFEIAAITLVALYALYLAGPDKPTRTHKTIKRNPDGSYEVVEKADYADFSEPVRALLGLFSKRPKKQK